ncbi:transcriptional regulator family: Fungal Specific TF [Paecilomyces variotii]|nr:transcriptional regulator family: Fungal Specific TF [Paecilomyces variotii]KAJ9240018.1 transcriptional regulator family: Fungal Specific TF [Paecilomyces variotii]
MVGTPRSTGCDNCRIRKKKCGEERPQCQACLAAGWPCPGYARRWKFINENQQLASYYQKKSYIFEEVDTVPSTVEDWNSDYNDLYSRPYGKLSTSAGFGTFRLTIPWPLTSEHDRSGSLLVYIIEDPKSQGLFPINSHGDYFSFIPSRIGHNVALDASVSCLCGLFIDIFTGNSTISETAIRRYMSSLRSLRECLDDERKRLESETICASVILQLCELVMNADDGRWSHLSRGTKVLIRNCGPERCAAPFERALLESQRAWFIMLDMSEGRECFLSQLQWRQLLQSPAVFPISKGPPSLSLRSKLCDLLVDGPDLLSEASKLSMLEASGLYRQSELERQRDHVIYRAVSMKQSIERWYIEEFEPSLLAHRPLANASTKAVPPSGLQSNLGIPRYPEVLFGVLDCISNSVLIRLDELLLSLTAGSLGGHNGAAAAVDPNITAQRQETVRTSFNSVRQSSRVAAKPLEFGMRQIWSIGRVFNQGQTFDI